MKRRGDARPVRVLRLMDPTPTFHLLEAWEDRRGPTRLDDGWTRNQHRTACGVVVWRVEWRDVPGRISSETRNELERGTYLRRDHAEAIGRLCDRCRARGGDR